MGLAASQARFLTLTARKSNIEFQGQQINQQRTVLANKSADVVNKMLALSPPTPPTSQEHDFYKVAQNFVNKSADGTNFAGDVTGQSEKIKSYRMIDADHTDADGNYLDPNDVPATETTSVRYEIEYTYMQAGQEMTGKMYTTATAFTIGAGTLAETITKTIEKMAADNIFKVDNATGDIVQAMEIDNVKSFTGGTGKSSYGVSDLVYGTSFDDELYGESMNQYDFDKYTYEKAIADINAETSGIQAKDKSLELKLKQLDSEHGAIQTELEAVKSVIDKNIEGTFKTFSK